MYPILFEHIKQRWNRLPFAQNTMAVFLSRPPRTDAPHKLHIERDN
jgi:hypothetical protein